jgi:dsRNA-specific ribonuclease
VTTFQSLEQTFTETLVDANECIDKVGSLEILGQCGRNMGLQHCISTNPSQQLKPPSTAIVGRGVQALFGAIWIDSQQNMQEIQQALQYLGLLNAVTEE